VRFQVTGVSRRLLLHVGQAVVLYAVIVDIIYFLLALLFILSVHRLLLHAEDVLSVRRPHVS
jgi:hypothetical protein